MKLFKGVILLILSFRITVGFAQSETFASGSYIINMGIPVQTIDNGLKPYGLVYELLKSYKVPVKWVIKSGKAKDDKDFTYLSVDYKGGTFIVPKEYITPEIIARIQVWESRGVIGVFTTSALTVPVSETLTSVPKWTLNSGNMAIAQKFFLNAGIPSSAYDIKSASSLNSCSDIFVIAHSDPDWDQVGKLYSWNRKDKGAIWSGCHAASELENTVNPMDTNQKLNFLSTNGLMNFDSHSAGTPAYSYFFNRSSYNGAPISARADDPVFQMMGSEDAAHMNGSEQVYIPKHGSAWRSSTHIGCYDSIQADVTSGSGNGPAALTLYGRGFGLNTSGLVMYQSGHNLDGKGPANVAAMRQFFNFSFEAMKDKVPNIISCSTPVTIEEGYTYNVSVKAESPVDNTLHYQWTSNCAGVFADANAAVTTFTPSVVDSNAVYAISCVVTDECSRYSFTSATAVGTVALPVTLVSFKAEHLTDEVLLTWSVVLEENLDRYEIFRSFNGQDFERIGHLNSDGKNIDLLTYLYTDRNVTGTKQPNIYYRLKLVDHNGGFKWSSICRVATMNDVGPGKIEFSVYPNPSIDHIYLDIGENSERELTITILDASGKQMHLLKDPEQNSNGITTVDISHLETGIYLVFYFGLVFLVNAFIILC